MSTSSERSKAIKQFIDTWKDRGEEIRDKQSFWLSLLHDLFGVEHPDQAIDFEIPVKLNNTARIDAFIPSSKVLIEHKSMGVNLRGKHRQSDGEFLTPFEQAKRYDNERAVSEKARYIVVCDFQSWLVYDMDKPHSEPFEIRLENLERDWGKLLFLYEDKPVTLRHETEVSIAAGKIIGDIYDAFLDKFGNDISEEELRQLNVLCVRLVFCMYAEDARLFGDRPDMFHDYLAGYKPHQMRSALARLFEALNKPEEQRGKFFDDDLAQFPYVNGGLFANDNIEIPTIDENIAELILQKASLNFDWSKISPTIFGGVFESTLNPDTRRRGGMHYTSVENIHRVIDPLFLSDLSNELDRISTLKEGVKRNRLLDEFTTKLSRLTFLDPACGSGNFLTETYLSLRRLENRALRIMLKNAPVLDVDNYIKVNIGQFYGIEINDFAVTVARTALWIAEAQMLKETESIVNRQIELFPLKAYANIVEANALTFDWRSLITPDRLDYIIGNPPFIGARNKSAQQFRDLETIFGKKHKGVGELDYVAGWYLKAARYMQGTGIRAAFVSTNSIAQGEQVSPLWTALWGLEHPAHIDFAWRTFRWNSEATDKAHVHVVIIGFSCSAHNAPKRIYHIDREPENATNINPYLIDGPNIVITARSQPICDVPRMGSGNKPIDGRNYLFNKQQMQSFISIEPLSANYFIRWYGSKEFINNLQRFCLWISLCTPEQLRSMPHVMKRIEAVRNFRLRSTDAGTRKLADSPTRFHVENTPHTPFIVISETSSKAYEYIPMDFAMPNNALYGNSIRIVPDATLYHFGVLQSNMHQIWIKAVCGRLKSDPRYSKDIVYNNFPWIEPTDEQRMAIETAAQEVLDTRKQFPGASLADLYHPLTMPAELRKAHNRLNTAVARAYGLFPTASDADVLTLLFKLYNQISKRL